jgi:hypothetical protein
MPARAIVQSVRVGAVEKARMFLVDSNFREVAACDGQGLLGERVSLSASAPVSTKTTPVRWSASTPAVES